MGFFDWLFGNSNRQKQLEEQWKAAEQRKELEEAEHQKRIQLASYQEVEKQKKLREAKALEEQAKREAKIQQEQTQRDHQKRELEYKQRQTKIQEELKAQLEKKANQLKEKADRKHQAEILAQQKLEQEKQVVEIRLQEQKAVETKKYEEEQRKRLIAEQQVQQENVEKQQVITHRLSLQESGTSYAQDMATVLQPVPNFWKMYEYNVSSTLHIPGWELLNSLSNGTAIIQESQTLTNYVAAYGGHHFYKLLTSYNALFPLLPENAKFEILDYGCGQALASLVFYDHMIRRNQNFQVSRITLIEPSQLALKRGILKLNYFIGYKNHHCDVVEVNKSLNSLDISDIQTSPETIKIHLFSNILDVTAFDYRALAEKIKESQKGINYCICVSPANFSAESRISAFQKCFANTNIPCVSGELQGKIFRQANKRWLENHSVKMFQRIFRYDA